MSIILYGLAGVVSGIVAGMGMGGGTLLIPILTIFLGVQQHLAQGINLIVFVPMSLVTLIIHCKNKLVDFKVGIPIILSGLISSIIGSLLALEVRNELLRKMFGYFLLLVGIWQIISALIPQEKTKNVPRVKVVGFLKFK
jgi:uncharacterized membrane protein YfcA